MKPTKVYVDAVSQFTKTIQDVPHIASVFLYGSMAREEIIPGYSDVDFWVILQDDAFANKKNFVETMAGLVESGELLANSGVPDFHAFCYYAASELDWLPAGLVPNLQSPRSSKVVVGTDVRAQMASTEASIYAHKMSYFADMRTQMFLPLTPYLAQMSFNEREEQHILLALKYVKYVAEAACASLNVFPGELDAITKLQELLPAVNTAVIHKIETFRIQYTAEDKKNLKSILVSALNFVEAVHLQLRRN